MLTGMLMAPAFVLATAQGATSAGSRSAESLFENCHGRSSFGQTDCFSYVAAVADAVQAYQTLLARRDLCIPAATSQGRLRDTFVDYLRANPMRGNDQAASVVMTALQAQFPCSAPPNPR